MTGKCRVPQAPDEVLEKGEQRAIDVRLLRAPPADLPVDPGIKTLAEALAPAFYLDVGNVCNQHCRYCAVPRSPKYQTRLDHAEAIVAGARSHGYDTAVFIGGEPTIWPHFRALLKTLSEAGTRRVILTTNGLALAYRAWLDEFAAANLTLVALSLDDFDPAVQRHLSRRADSPELLARAVDNLADADLQSTFYTVITRHLAGRGAEFSRQFLATHARFKHAPALFLAGLKPLAEAITHTDELALPLGEAAAVMRTIIEALEDRATVSFRDLPLCLLPDHVTRSMDLYHEHAALDLASGRLTPAPLARDRAFAPRCTSCRLRAWCPGIYRAYLAAGAEEEFVPFA